MKAYNSNLVSALTPGRYLCVDESMNQWLGHGMPNLKKIPRKPHSIGQEFKTVADVKTCCIIQLDFSGDTCQRDFDDVHKLKTVASVCRLTRPWFYSGRTIIADSWFGSPAMVRAMKEYGLFSIMQVKKRSYWPRNMPPNVLEELGATFGSTVCMKAREDGVYVSALRDKKPKVVIANCGITAPSATTTRRYIDGRICTMNRPQVFDEYERNKGTTRYMYVTEFMITNANHIYCRRSGYLEQSSRQSYVFS